MKSIKTTIGGAFSALGTSLMGIGSVTGLSTVAAGGHPATIVYVIMIGGFILSSVGKFFSALWSADKSDVADTTYKGNSR